ncbi:MAG: hypothetical protein AMS27_12495 [Bacteroides sp. SM23_62_1]|nr:MAG: hypothetical protein AMS27_12495 [Bacteroides sp. SM23_62_1]
MIRPLCDIIILILFMIIMNLLMVSCREEEPLEVFFEEEELLISAYLEEHEDKYSSLVQVLEITELKNTLNAYGHYTFFAPDNNAFQEFCNENGKSSITDFEKDYLTTLVKYHLIDIELECSYLRDGVIQDTTYSGDHLVITYSTGGLETIMVNDANIMERDIHVENGIIHRIDGVLTPIVGSIMDRLRDFEGYAIFSEALEVSGLSDTLDMIRIDLNDDIFIRSRFTIFTEPDEVYNQEGIFSINDLLEKYSDKGNPTDEENGFYQYMAYHVLPGLYFLNDIDSFNYPTLAENKLVNVKIRDNIYLNWNGEQNGGQMTVHPVLVLEEFSNQQAKNGVFHAIDHILEPCEPAPAYLMIDLTDYQGLSIGRSYSEKDLEDIPGITCKNTGIYFRNSILADGETNLQTTSNKAGWVVEFTLIPILRGKYDVHLHFASHSTNTNKVQGFWDGARFGDILDFEHQVRDPEYDGWKRDFNTSEYLGRILLTDTRPHTIKFVSLEDGYGNFDYLILWPVNN